MTNYRETSAYDLSLFEPQVVETKRVRETEPVRKQQVKRTPAKKTSSKKTVKKQSRPQSVDYTRTANSTVRRAVESVDSHQHTVARNSKRAAVSPLLIKTMAIILCLLSAVVVRLFMFVESDKLDAQIADVQNEIAIQEGETVRLSAELNGMIDSQKAIEYADISENDTVMDIYCGIGTISLTAAKKAKKVIGVEIVDRAIEDAKKNAKANGITNAEFYAGSAEKIVPWLIQGGEKPDIVIIDPPRKGSDEVTLSTIISANPKRIVYVSCNPATLARDIKILNNGGYKLEKVTAVDMFPNTCHVECCVLLCRT